MGLLDKIKRIVQRDNAEPLQTDMAEISQTGRILSDHPVDKLTPATLKGILEDAERGDITAQHELFMDIEEQDADIGANIQTRKRAALTLDWQIIAPMDATSAETELTKVASELFAQMGNLEDLIVDCMDAVGHGFSALEIQWELRGSQYYPRQFIHRPPSWFALDKEDNLLLKTPQNKLGEPLNQYGWVVHRHKNRSVQLARNGLFRTLAWLYMFKFYSVRDFAEFLELYGLPIRIGKYGAGATNDEKRSLLRALADIGHNAAGIMPESMQVELHNIASGTSNGNNPFLQMVDWCERSIARLILGQTLTSGADGKTSTNALGQVHNEVRRDLLISDVKQLGQTFTQQIILPYLVINFPNVDVTRLPRFEFDTREPADIKALAEAIPKLVGVGVQIPHNWAVDKLGIPEVKDGEAVLNAVQTPFETAVKPDKTALSATMPSCQCGCQSAVALSHSGGGDEQKVLEQCLAEAFQQGEFNTQLHPAIKHAYAALQSCQSYEEASEKLAALYPTLSSEQHFAYLGNALFLAELLGASNAQR